jgi:hypothetical protein
MGPILSTKGLFAVICGTQLFREQICYAIKLRKLRT